MEPELADPGERGRPASLGRNSAARFIADLLGVILCLAGSIIAARGLGPDGKGVYSSMTFLASIVVHAAMLGLGDAAIVMVGQRRWTLQHAVSATMAAGACSSLAGMAVFWVTAMVLFSGDWAEARSAAVIACVGIPPLLFFHLFTYVMAAQERIVASSFSMVVSWAGTTLGLWLFVVAFSLEVPGGVLGTVFGFALAAALGAGLVVRSGLSLRPAWDRSYLSAAVRYGVTVGASSLVTVLFLRTDLLLTYALAGSGPAGQYSVALTAATIVTLLPMAIAYATFPRLAQLDDVEAVALTARACRVATTAAVGGALFLLATVPTLIPLFFGEAFRPAVGPALLLLPGSVVWSVQWVLCRAEAARGRPALILLSFGLSLVVMCGLDLLLIPAFGTTGAALAAVCAQAFGLVLSVVAYRRSPHWPVPLRRLVPGIRDVRDLLAITRQLVPSVGKPGTRSPDKPLGSPTP